MPSALWFGGLDRGDRDMRLLAALAAALLLAAAPAGAAKLDLAALKCRDFLGAGKENMSVIMTWLDAYYLGKDDPPVIDFERMSQNAAKLGQYCAGNGDSGLIAAADKVIAK
jgi:acid stress chaperone HdeB